MSEHIVERRRNVALAVAIAIDGRPKYKIAADVGIDPPTFSGIVSGRVEPRPDQQAKIAAAFGLDEHDLFAEVTA